MSVIQRYTYKVGTVVPGPQNVCNLNYLSLPFQVGIIVDIVSGAADYGIEFTGDDMNAPVLRWMGDTYSLPSGQTASGVFLINVPVTAIRLNLATITGEVRLTVIQPIGTL